MAVLQNYDSGHGDSREQLWNHMCNVKFKAVYAALCARRVSWIGVFVSSVVAIGTAGSIASWAIWQSYGAVWAAVVASIQVIQILKPNIPYVGNDSESLETSHRFSRLFLDFELLWKETERGDITSEELDKRLYDLQVRELDIQEKFLTIKPNWRGLIEKSNKQKEHEMTLAYPSLAKSGAIRCLEENKDE